MTEISADLSRTTPRETAAPLPTDPSPPTLTDASMPYDVRGVLADLLSRLGPGAAFGEVVRENGTAVLPVSEVRVGFGLGSGSGTDLAAEPADHAASARSSGGGGGAWGRVVPRGFIRVTSDDARFVPLTDPPALLLRALALLAGVAAVALWRAR